MSYVVIWARRAGADWRALDVIPARELGEVLRHWRELLPLDQLASVPAVPPGCGGGL